MDYFPVWREGHGGDGRILSGRAGKGDFTIKRSFV